MPEQLFVKNVSRTVLVCNLPMLEGSRRSLILPPGDTSGPMDKTDYDCLEVSKALKMRVLMNVTQRVLARGR